MTLVRRGTFWRYDFWLHGHRYQASTQMTTRADAEAVEAAAKKRLRRMAVGLEVAATPAPSCSDWFEAHYRHVAPSLERPDQHAVYLRVLLRFFGPRPAVEAVAGEPYHDLPLDAPMRDASWVLRFEQWLADRKLGAQSRKHYRAALRKVYQTAMLPQFQLETGITANPFSTLPREHTPGRDVAITVEMLRRWIGCASYHVRLAVAIGALAPKMRLRTILELRWSQIDTGGQWITVTKHKTARSTGAQVVPISAALREILDDARVRAPKGATHVVTYQGRAVSSIRDGVRAAVVEARLPYGRATEGGITFHTIRHSMATMLAELGEPEKARAEALGHADIATTQRYTHLRPVHQRPTLERLATVVKIGDLVTARGRRAATRVEPGARRRKA